MSAQPARHRGPAPATSRERLAEVIPLWRNRSRPPRRSINGHHADCPYPRADAEFCGICASIRKGTP